MRCSSWVTVRPSLPTAWWVGAALLCLCFVAPGTWSAAITTALAVAVTLAMVWLMAGNIAARGALKESEERFRLLAELTPVGIIQGDVDGKVLFCNEAYCRITGRPKAQFLSGEVGWASITPPEWLEVDEKAIAQVRNTGSCPPYEKEYLRPDGTRVPVLVGFSLFGKALQHTAAFVFDLSDQKRAEHEIKNSEARFRATFDNAAVGIALVSRDGRWLQVNERLCAIVGYSHDELLTSNFQSITHPADLLEDLALAEEVAQGLRAHYSIEKRFLRKDRSWAWVNLTVSAKQTADGVFDHFISVVEDISKRHDAEEALQAALNASRTGTFRWNISTGQVSWDTELRHLFGLPGNTPIASLDDFLSRVHPDYRAPVAAELRRCQDLGDDFDLEFKIIWPDGSERWIYDRGRALRDHTGTPVWMTGACVDITERKLAEEDLLRREQMLRAVTDNTPDMLARFDRRLRHVFVNSAVERLTGRAASAFIGRTHRELGTPPQLCRLWKDALESVFTDAQPVTIEFEFQGPSQRHHFHCRCIPEIGANGEVEHVLAVAHDRTAERQATMALREADRRKDEFLATLAHELRNPLAPLRNGLSILAKVGHAEQGARVRDMMERQLAHMVRLVDDLLDISRVTTGKVALHKDFTPLQTAVQFAVEATRPLAEASAHRLTLEIPQQPVWVHGDQTRIAQIVSNLLTNAIKYTPAGGQIALKLWQEGSQAVMEVTDNGVGIPADCLPHVFEMFSQVNAHADRAQGGLGIGLALVRALVDMHGGQISARSPGIGQGSTFTVLLPAVDEKLIGALPADGLAPTDSGIPRRILAVDDNQDAVASLADMLRLDGHTVRVAFDGPAALQMAQEFDPEVVLLDIGMPGMDGHEVGRRLRSLPRFSSTRLVALTGWGTAEDKALALAAGFDSHLTKPVSPEALNRPLKEDGPSRPTGPRTT